MLNARPGFLSVFFLALSASLSVPAWAATGLSISESAKGRALRVSPSGKGLIERKVPDFLRYPKISRGIRLRKGRATQDAPHSALFHELWRLMPSLTRWVAKQAPQSTALSDAQKGTIARIAELVAAQGMPPLKLVSEKKFPTTFSADPADAHRIAYTEFNPKKPVLVNRTHLAEIAASEGAPTRARLLSYLGLSFHELGHKLGLRDTPERELDQLGSAIVELMQSGIEELGFGDSRLLVCNLEGARSTRVLYADRSTLVDLTESIDEYFKVALTGPAGDAPWAFKISNPRVDRSSHGETRILMDALTRAHEEDGPTNWNGHIALEIRTKDGKVQIGKEPRSADIQVRAYERVPDFGDSELRLDPPVKSTYTAGETVRLTAKLKLDPRFKPQTGSFRSSFRSTESLEGKGVVSSQIGAPVTATWDEASGLWNLLFQFQTPVYSRATRLELESLQFADETLSQEVEPGLGDVALGFITIPPLLKTPIEIVPTPDAVLPKEPLKHAWILDDRLVEQSNGDRPLVLAASRVTRNAPILAFVLGPMKHPPIHTQLIARALTSGIDGKARGNGVQFELHGERAQYPSTSAVMAHAWIPIKDGSAVLYVYLNPDTENFPSNGLPISWKFDEIVVSDESYHQQRFPISMELRYRDVPAAIPGLGQLPFIRSFNASLPENWY